MKLGPTVRCVLLSLVLCATSVAQTEPSSLLRLTAERPGDTRSVDLHLNDRIELAGTVVNVVSIRPWRGLVERNTGAALIHFSVRPGDHEWLHDQVLKDGDRIVLDDRLAITFMWAEEDSSPPKPRAFRGRWGVREGERTTWSESWVPGSGFTLVDGSEVTLLERSGDGTIRVQIDQSVRRRVLDVPPKTESPEGIINDGVQPTALVIDMTATAGRRIRAHVQSGDSAESFDLSPGQVFNWSVAGAWCARQRRLCKAVIVPMVGIHIGSHTAGWRRTAVALTGADAGARGGVAASCRPGDGREVGVVHETPPLAYNARLFNGPSG